MNQYEFTFWLKEKKEKEKEKEKQKNLFFGKSKRMKGGEKNE
jgi:hypothetical protein